MEGASGNLDTLIEGEAGRISQILEHINSITANLEQNNGEISRTLSNFAAISDSIRQANLKQTLLVLQNALSEVDSILIKMNEGRGTLGAFVNNDEFYYNLNQVSENLNRLLVEFRYNPKKFINLSLIDFSSGKKDNMEYGIVIYESENRLSPEAEMYKQNPNLKEVRYKGKYLYIWNTYKKLKSAQRQLDNVMKRYNNAYIVKIDFI